MGNTIDISHTILGNSLINKKFITKVPFYYRMYIDGSEYFSHTHFFEEYEVFDPGMVFKVNKVERKWGIDAGISLRLHISIFIDYEYSPKVRNIIMSISSYPLQTAFPFEFANSDINFNLPIKINTDVVDLL